MSTEPRPGLAETLADLDRIARVCSDFFWDAYDALPVRPATVERVRRLLKTMPADIPLPDIGPEPDGSIGMDWDFGDSGHVIVSVPEEGRIAFSVTRSGAIDSWADLPLLVELAAQSRAQPA